MELFLVVAVVALALAAVVAGRGGASAGSGGGARAGTGPGPIPGAAAAGGPPAGATIPPVTAPDDPVEELLPAGILHVRGLRVAAATGPAHRLLGAAPGRLVGRTLMEALLDAAAEEALAGAIAERTVVAELRRGGDRVLVLRGRRRVDGSLDVVVEEVTELRRLERMRSAFTDNLAHELRTPLATIVLLGETLARDAEAAGAPARMRERIARIEEETGHLVQMTNELLDLARIEGGSVLDPADDVDLAALVERSVERLRVFAERQGVVLAVRVAAGLPPARADAERVGQVVVNLVHNAVKFSPEGGEVRIEVGLAPGPDAAAADAPAGAAIGGAGAEAPAPGPHLRVAITDHGIGISAADLPRVFERFYKADRARVRGGGTGLGLAISRHIVEAHGGTLVASSTPGTGSTFAFTIPVGAPPGARPPSE